MAYQDISESRLYCKAEAVADETWSVVIKWPPFAHDTIGKQLSRAADSAKLTDELESLAIEINSYIKFQKTRAAKETNAEYNLDPDTDQLTTEPTNQRTN